VAEQLVVLLLPLQLIVPPGPQFAVALQRAFPWIAGRVATDIGVFTGAARDARKAWSATLSIGATRGESGAAIAGDAIRLRDAKTNESPRTIFFITISFLERSSSHGKPPQTTNVAFSHSR
jgi:hypothetical protein